MHVLGSMHIVKPFSGIEKPRMASNFKLHEVGGGC
jgi:hypothetical protein